MDKKAQLTIIGAAIILVTVVTITYGFFVSGVDNSNPQTATITTGTMELTFADNDTGVAKQMIFGESIEKKFTLENTGTVDATAYLYWKDLVNTYLYGSLVYKLEYSETANGEKTEILKERNVPSSTSLEQLSNKITVPSEKTYYYTLTITLVNSETVDQTADINASFVTGFTIDVNGEQIEATVEYPTIVYFSNVGYAGTFFNFYNSQSEYDEFLSSINAEVWETKDVSVNGDGSVMYYDVYDNTTLMEYGCFVGNGSGKINVTQEFYNDYVDAITTGEGADLVNIIEAVEFGTFSVDVEGMIYDEATNAESWGIIETISYQFEIGMTWNQFIESDYNTDNKFTINDRGQIFYNVSGVFYSQSYGLEYGVMAGAGDLVIINNDKCWVEM